MKLFKLKDSDVLVWNQKDIETLRTQYRIVGKLIGSHPNEPRQNQYLSVPLYLTPSEVTLLLEKGFASLYDGNVSHWDDLQLVEKRRQIFGDHVGKSLSDQRTLAYEQKKTEIWSKADEIIKGLSKKGKVKSEPTEEGKQHIIGELIQKIQPITDQHMLVHIPTESPWCENVQTSPWSYPSTESETLKYLVFKNLWQQGFYITNGAKFGGDFLVYPGDPGLYHAKYIAVCFSETTPMVDRDVVQLARLASNVKKTALICSVDLNSQKVVFTKLNYNSR